MLGLRYISRCVGKPVIRYVDTSGITVNPPQYVDLIKNKTINFKMNKESISIDHIPAFECLEYIQNIATLFALMNRERDYVATTWIDGVKQKVRYRNSYLTIIKLISKLSLPHAKNKRRFKKELKEKAKDSEFIFLMIEQILDYWKYTGKLIALLSQGTTLKQTVGELYIWSSVEWDDQDKIVKKPRYGNT